jgi:hypothetical protein
MASNARLPRLEEFLASRLAPRFAEQRTLIEQRLAEIHRQLEDLYAAQGTIAWEVESSPPAVCYANIAGGEMTVGPEPLEEPILRIVQSPEDWAKFTAGLPAMFTVDPRRPLGKSRIERLRSLRGAIRFVLSGVPGGGEWSCWVLFGGEPKPAEPRVTIQIPAEALAQIQSGTLDPQAAFLQGQVRLAGDMGFAMQVGMALFL